MKIIVYNPATNLFDFFLDALLLELNNINIDLIIYNNNDFFENKTINYNKDIILIIINPHFIYDYIDIQKNLLSIKNKFRYKILYITEPINFIIEKKIYKDIINIIKPFVLWTYTYENFNKLFVNLKIFRIFPLYNIKYNFIDKINFQNIKNRNNSNIIFIGNITDNRKEICNMFGNILINVNNIWTKNDWGNILNNNLFYLNIHRRIGCKSLELFRIIPILSNGGVIFSESVNEEEEKEFKDYNIIFTNRDNLLNLFTEFKNNIDYEDIYYKLLMYKKNMLNKSGLDKFIEYYKNL